MPAKLSREDYALRYGPTTCDLVRLGDTDLWIRVERDDVAYGDELTYGWGQTVRTGMAIARRASPSELDVVLIGALVLDPVLGVVKTSLGIKEGRITAVGRAGNPETMDDITAQIGPHTEVIAAHGLIATPGAIDSHVHLLTPRLIPSALSGGITTLITAGWEEPVWRWQRTVEAFEQLPVNIGLQATARTDDPGATERLILEMGCPGLKVHEDFAAYPEVIAATLDLCEAHDIQLCLHTDGLHESGELEETIAAIGGRTMHAYHVEGAGGGHVPDLIALVREPHVICSSTNPAIPWGPSSATEHLMMTMLVHGLSPDLPEQVAMVRERIHPATMAAEGPLHELGGIQIIASDSQGMGRIGETVRKTWQLAHAMKTWRGSEDGHGWPSGSARRAPTSAITAEPVVTDDDNDRVLRYLAKYTIEPAITHGISHHVGTLAPGRLADVVLWSPESFGVRPALVIKGGLPAWSPLGEGNASVTLAEPVRYGPQWGGVGTVAALSSALFVSQAGHDLGVAAPTGTRRQIIPVQNCRNLTRDDLWANREAVPIEVDVHDGTVFLDGRILATPPVTTVPLSRRYLLA